MANAASPAQYQILTLSKDGNTPIRLDGKTVSFDYYESLLSPNITAIMSFVDTGGSTSYNTDYYKQGDRTLGTIYNALPLTGDGSEEIRFKIVSGLGTLDFSKTPLYVNSAVNPDQDSQRESVILSLVSRSAIANQETHVKKNYSGTIISDAVSKISKNILQITNLKLEKTANRYPFIGNNKSPFDVICMLASKSAPEKGNPGFFFYETREGHNFKSIDTLIDQEPVAEYYRTDVNRSSVGNDSNNFKISLFSLNKNQNLINALKSGVYTNRTVLFNPKTFQEEEVTFTLGNLEKSLGKKEVHRPKNKNYTRTLYSIKDVGALSPQPSENNRSGDPKTWQGKVQMRYNLLFTQVAKIQVPCNPNLKAGDVIKCNFETITASKKEEIPVDPVQSGNYLILDLCHHYDSERSFTSMTLVRDTYGLYTNKS